LFALHEKRDAAMMMTLYSFSLRKKKIHAMMIMLYKQHVDAHMLNEWIGHQPKLILVTDSVVQISRKIKFLAPMRESRVTQTVFRHRKCNNETNFTAPRFWRNIPIADHVGGLTMEYKTSAPTQFKFGSRPILPYRRFIYFSLLYSARQASVNGFC